MITSCKANAIENPSMYVISILKIIFQSNSHFYLLDDINLEEAHLELNSTTIHLYLVRMVSKRRKEDGIHWNSLWTYTDNYGDGPCPLKEIRPSSTRTADHKRPSQLLLSEPLEKKTRTGVLCSTSHSRGAPLSLQASG